MMVKFATTCNDESEDRRSLAKSSSLQQSSHTTTPLEKVVKRSSVVVFECEVFLDERLQVSMI